MVHNAHYLCAIDFKPWGVLTTDEGAAPPTLMGQATLERPTTI